MIYAKKELCPKEVFSDKKGRYIAIEILYQNKKMLVVNLYALNGPKSEFFKMLHKKTTRYNYEHIVQVILTERLII